MTEITTSKPSFVSRVRTLFAYGIGLYIVLLVGYLLLRVVFRDGIWWLAFLNSFAHLLFMPLILLFPLAILIHQRSALRLLPVVLIAGLWFAPYYVPKSLLEPDSTPLHIVTFNVWGANPHTDVVEDWLREANADIVLLQEIPEAQAEDQFSTLSDVYPYRFVQSPQMRLWGNAIFSRLPFVETENFDLEGDGTPSHQRVTFEWDGELFALYNIHLVMPVGDQAHLSLPVDSALGKMALRYDDTLRNDEINRLLGRLKDERLPFIVGGDFNLSDQSVMYGQLAAQMRDSFREVGTGLGGSWPLPLAGEFPAFMPPLLRIDYLWHSDSFQAVAVQQSPPLGSDHLGLIASLTLR
jgi:vancomycin resistance protein VanJ